MRCTEDLYAILLFTLRFMFLCPGDQQRPTDRVQHIKKHYMLCVRCIQIYFLHENNSLKNPPHASSSENDQVTA